MDKILPDTPANYIRENYNNVGNLNTELQSALNEVEIDEYSSASEDLPDTGSTQKSKIKEQERQIKLLEAELEELVGHRDELKNAWIERDYLNGVVKNQSTEINALQRMLRESEDQCAHETERLEKLKEGLMKTKREH